MSIRKSWNKFANISKILFTYFTGIGIPEKALPKITEIEKLHYPCKRTGCTEFIHTNNIKKKYCSNKCKQKDYAKRKQVGVTNV